MKRFQVVIVTNDDTTVDDIKDLLSHYDGNTEYETTDEPTKIIVPYVEEVTELK